MNAELLEQRPRHTARSQVQGGDRTPSEPTRNAILDSTGCESSGASEKAQCGFSFDTFDAPE